MDIGQILRDALKGGILAKPVETVEDIIDERARFLAKKFNIETKNILRGYKELNELKQIYGKPEEIDYDNPELPINLHMAFGKAHVYRAIVHYELTKRDTIVLPMTYEFDNQNQETPFLMLKYSNPKIRRFGTVLKHEDEGRYHAEKAVDEFNMQNRFIADLLEVDFGEQRVFKDVLDCVSGRINPEEGYRSGLVINIVFRKTDTKK